MLLLYDQSPDRARFIALENIGIDKKIILPCQLELETFPNWIYILAVVKTHFFLHKLRIVDAPSLKLGGRLALLTL